MIKTYQILNAIVLVCTIVINYLSNTGVFNNETMASVSDRYHNLFTPAGYAFSIWGLIYLGLMGFVIHYGPLAKSTMAKNKTVKSIGWWFVVSCVANSLWVMAWLYEFTFVSILIMIIMLVSLLKIIMNTRTDMNKPGWAPVVFLRLPFAIYAGWITVALIADVAAYLTKIGWDGFGISETLWTIIMFAVAVLVHLFMIWKRGMPDFAASAGWALIAIAVANKDVNNTVYLAAIVAAAILLVNGIIRLLQRPILQYH